MSRSVLQDERGYNQVFKPVGSTPLRMRRRGDWFVMQIERLGARRVLEIGSGTGDTAAYLAEHSRAEIVAVDVSATFVARHAHVTRHLIFAMNCSIYWGTHRSPSAISTWFVVTAFCTT